MCPDSGIEFIHQLVPALKELSFQRSTGDMHQQCTILEFYAPSQTRHHRPHYVRPFLYHLSFEKGLFQSCFPQIVGQ